MAQFDFQIAAGLRPTSSMTAFVSSFSIEHIVVAPPALGLGFLDSGPYVLVSVWERLWVPVKSVCRRERDAVKEFNTNEIPQLRLIVERPQVPPARPINISYRSGGEYVSIIIFQTNCVYNFKVLPRRLDIDR